MTKKKTRKSQSKTTNKKISKKQTNKSKPTTDTSSKVLLVIFLILCVVVFVLATIMITSNGKNKKDKYDIRVPITQEELKDSINLKINMDDVSKNQSKEYKIQVTNYIDKTINDKVVKYQMKVSTSSKKDKVDIELYSNKDNFELLNGKKKITNLSLGKDKKDQTTYTLKLIQRQNPTSKQYVNVEITEDE